MLEQAAAASNAVDAAAAMAIAAEGTSTAMAANGAAGAAPAADAAATTPAVGTPAATDAASANHPTLVADGGAATPTDGAAGASATVDSLQERTRRRAGARARYEDEHAPSLRPAAAVNTPSASGGTALSLVAAGSGAAVATPAMIASAQDGTAAATDSAAAGTPAATPVAGAGVAMPAAAGSARQPTRRRSVPATRYDDEHPSFVRQKATGKRNISQAWQSGEGRIDREEEEEGGEEEEEGGGEEEEGGGEEEEESGEEEEESGEEESGEDAESGEEAESGGDDDEESVGERLELIDWEGAITRVAGTLRDALERRDGGLTWHDEMKIERLVSKRNSTLEEQQQQVLHRGLNRSLLLLPRALKVHESRLAHMPA